MKLYKPMLARSAEVPEPERFNEQLRLEKRVRAIKLTRCCTGTPYSTAVRKYDPTVEENEQ